MESDVDSLDGRGGLDALNGGNGTDRLDGGRDGRQDVLVGGADADNFVRWYRNTRVAGQVVRRSDEVLLDFDATQGDTTEENPMV